MTQSLNKFGIIALAVILVAAGIVFYLKEEVPTLYINEFMAINSSCCPDTDGGRDEFEDWIELYNPGTTPIDIGGMWFSQDQKKPLGYQIPKTNSELTTIQPGGFLVLWADGTPDQGVLHLKFKLNQNGEYIGLFHEDGRTIDGLKFEKQSENISYGRTRDGGKEWDEFSVPTPGKSNQ
jgi:Lamin Tail Domain